MPFPMELFNFEIDSIMLTLVLASLLLAAYYFYLTRTFDYWTKRGVKHDKPVPLFGNNIKNFLLQANCTDVATETYKKNPNERLVGFFRGSRPEMLIRDPELAKNILVRDFHCFHRRGIVTPSPGIVLLKTPIFADDDMWRLLRLRWTRAFSSGKIKAMFSVITERAESLQARLSAVAAGQTVDAKDLMLRFTNDTLGSIAFGVACDSINNDDDAMRHLSSRVFTINVSRIIIHTLKCLMPKTFAHLNLLGDVQKDVIEMAQSVLRHRNYEPDNRNDFIDLLLEVKKDGAMTGDSIVQENYDGTPKKVSIEMDDGLVAAQCLTFFGAGYEASAAITSYTLHELGHNPHVQEKVKEEIDRVLARHDHKLSYEAISEMSYVKWSLYEAMRMFPSVGVLARKCVLPYTFPGTNVSIEPGVRVIIPLAAYHNDPKIFPEPEEFRPERFDPEIMTPERKTAYLPFGRGPRACVGERLAVLVSAAGLAAILARYSVLPAPGASRRPVLNPASSVINLLKRGMPVVFQRRQ